MVIQQVNLTARAKLKIWDNNHGGVISKGKKKQNSNTLYRSLDPKLVQVFALKHHWLRQFNCNFQFVFTLANCSVDCFKLPKTLAVKSFMQ